MKTFVKSAVLSVMGLSAALTVGCSKARLDSPVTPDNGREVEIALGAQIGTPGDLTSSAKRTSGLSRAVLDTDFAGPLFVSFARLDQDETTGAYPAYSTVDSAFLAKWEGALTDDDSKATTIHFCDPKFYLSRATNNSTKLVGWYPAYAAQTALGTDGSVSIAIDGKTDIMLTEELEANKTVRFGNYVADGDADNRIFHFEHLLTQLHFFAYAIDAYAPSVWGKIKSVTLKDQLPTCKITLPATVEFEGAAADLALTGKKVSDDSDIDYSAGLEYTFDSSIVAGSADEQTKREEAATECGYALIAPVKSKANGGALSLVIVTEKENADGSKEQIETTIPVVLPAKGFEVGMAYNIYLRFSSVNIEPKATISKWQEGDNVEITL